MKKEILLTFIITLTAIYNIFSNLDQLFSLSVGLSIIGLLGVVLYMAKIKYFDICIWMWILLQLPIISLATTSNSVTQIDTIFNLNQVALLSWNFKITIGSLSVGLNIIPLVFLLLYKALVASSIIGSTVALKPVTELSPLIGYTPLQATVTDITADNAFLAELDKKVIVDDMSYNQISFKTSDKSKFKLKKVRQKCNATLHSDTHKSTVDTMAFIQ